jgi:DNA mismatch endonuclease (patch repair protein)
MADIVDSATRSRMMRGIRGKDTRPELMLRRALHAEGFRYRLHVRDLPGKPDMVLPRYRAVIFVHGCFWHGHDCPLFRLPATRPEFWREKIGGNRARDARVIGELLSAAWRVLSVWECAFRGKGAIGFDETVARAAAWLRGSETTGDIRGVIHGAG